MKHTELPWHLNQDNELDVCSEDGKVSRSFATGIVGQSKANAAFIVKAVNSFYEHVELLKLLTYTGDYEGRPSIEDVLNRAREAIKAAEQ